MNTKLLQRIRRIYSSIGAVEETDPNKLKAAVIATDEITGVFQDFRGGLTDYELSNLAHMLIHNIANLRDHLRKWAVQNGKDKEKVDRAFAQSLELKIIQDLSDNDKHGYPPRNGSRSGKYPQLIDINRVMQLKTQAKKGSTIGMTLGAGGAPKFFGDGTAKAIITGDVVDNKNNRIGGLHTIATKAVEAWEQLLSDFGCRD
ncbi:MAG: hypothetical protein KAV87_45135 [Desulfobacteraceae bacterium]|nr:hypothetical protein [Desulfobacteraceae bacterium]